LQVDVGFEPRGLLTMEYRLPKNKYPERAAQAEIQRRIRCWRFVMSECWACPTRTRPPRRGQTTLIPSPRRRSTGSGGSWGVSAVRERRPGGRGLGTTPPKKRRKGQGFVPCAGPGAGDTAVENGRKLAGGTPLHGAAPVMPSRSTDRVRPSRFNAQRD
jgi:hypothetical protein